MTDSIRRIVLTTDLSPASWSALGLATELCDRLGASLTVLSIVEDHAYLSQLPLDSQMVEILQESVPAVREHIATYLSEHSVSAEIAVVQDRHTATAIIEQLSTLGADLLVMATHGRTGLSRLLLGSTAEKVLHTSTVPVLTVRVTQEIAPIHGADTTPSGSQLPASR